MPHHFALHSSALIVGVVAFVVAAAIFGFFAWRASRMSRSQVEHFSQLPFTTDTASDRHDTSV